MEVALIEKHGAVNLKHLLKDANNVFLDLAHDQNHHSILTAQPFANEPFPRNSAILYPRLITPPPSGIERLTLTRDVQPRIELVFVDPRQPGCLTNDSVGSIIFEHRRFYFHTSSSGCFCPGNDLFNIHDAKHALLHQLGSTPPSPIQERQRREHAEADINQRVGRHPVITATFNHDALQFQLRCL
ncbi:hypothetical protein [Xanthomonas translucens]|uniref:hypothetical protein n=1 Tax=Xanthomonas campestris pv. translucens TaxID=343 RepID=UPI00200AD1D1|nr:hypothetical protein [Xanthomonas translucens]UPU47966.1 hypothetical protein MZO50_14585 [Xanthomonas translucens pv. undulosa]